MAASSLDSLPPLLIAILEGKQAAIDNYQSTKKGPRRPAECVHRRKDEDGSVERIFGAIKLHYVSKYTYFHPYQRGYIERNRPNLSYVVNGPLF